MLNGTEWLHIPLECTDTAARLTEALNESGADPDIRNIRTGECQILLLEYSIASSRLHKATTSLLLM